MLSLIKSGTKTCTRKMAVSFRGHQLHTVLSAGLFHSVLSSSIKTAPEESKAEGDLNLIQQDRVIKMIKYHCERETTRVCSVEKSVQNISQRILQSFFSDTATVIIYHNRQPANKTSKDPTGLCNPLGSSSSCEMPWTLMRQLAPCCHWLSMPCSSLQYRS